MIKVAVLDDEKMYLQRAQRVSEEYFEEKGVACKIETFQNPEWFLLGIKDEVYDIYILDVEMPGKTGLNVAREIRRLYPEPIILFVTNYMDYAVEAYEVNTYRYIPKSLLEEKLVQAYETLLPKIQEQEEKHYVIEKRSSVEKLSYADIYYLQKDGKYVIIFHRGGESRVRKPLTEVYEELNSGEFLMIDKSYAVNIRHIMSFKDHVLHMRNEVQLPVGRTRLMQIKQAVAEYWRQK